MNPNNPYGPAGPVGIPTNPTGPPSPYPAPGQPPYPAQPSYQPAPAPGPMQNPMPQQQAYPQPAPNPYGYPPQQPMLPTYPVNKPRNKRKQGVFVIIGIFVLIGVGVGVVLLTSGKAKTDSNKIVSTGPSKPAVVSDVSDRKDGTLDLSTLIDNQTTIKNQTLTGKLNQQVNESDGTSFMVTKVTRNWTSTSKYLVADPGKELIKVNVVIGNRAKEGTIYASSTLFKLKNAAGGLQDSEFVEDSDGVADALKAGDVQPGKQVTGSIIFSVDKAENVSLIYSKQYKNFKTDATVNVGGEVALQ